MQVSLHSDLDEEVNIFGEDSIYIYIYIYEHVSNSEWLSR